VGTTHRFQAAHLHALTRRLFEAAGAPRHIADDVAEILVNSNLAGHDSHGVLRIPAYLRGISDGGIVPAAEPKVVRETAVSLLLDGNGGFGHYTARKAMGLAIRKARQADVCSVSFVRIGHMGRLGEYAEAAARAGCIGLITYGSGGRNSGSTVPFGGAGKALGTNPIAVGVPTGDDIPFIIDFATSTVAEGKLQVARSKNADLPQGLIVDRHGRPSVKPADFYDGGFLLPFGGHKGYALSLLVCLLSGLSGNFNAEKSALGGMFMQVMNVNAFTPLETYQRSVRAFLDGVKATPPAPGHGEVLVPGDFERRSRAERLTHGVELPDTIYAQIGEWAEKLNVSLGEEGVETADVERYQTV
jgi:LDH2 family malate/lactate/ureidoglycolate dehydrogenase